VTTILAAVAVGIIVGLLTKGHLRDLTRARLYWLPVLLAGAALQIVGAVLLSYAVLAVFTVRNVTRLGMGVVFVGLALNAAPIVLNNGMPVEGHAIVSARIATDPSDVSISGKRHLAHAGDHLRALDDTIPEWWTHEVLSFGDLVIAVGVAAVIAGLLHPAYTPSVSHRS
jgi:hypothetical protein